MVVIKSINIEENKKVVSSLFSFCSNLCYGSNKFKVMLRSENLKDFFKTLKNVLVNNDII